LKKTRRLPYKIIIVEEVMLADEEFVAGSRDQALADFIKIITFNEALSQIAWIIEGYAYEDEPPTFEMVAEMLRGMIKPIRVEDFIKANPNIKFTI
jgi:hypothetical protein